MYPLQKRRRLISGEFLNEVHLDEFRLNNFPCVITNGLVSLFNGISTFAGYLMPKPFS